MSWNGAGVYTRGYPSWSNDAANNLPISATKFDTEDNDFAAGINNCLTKDGQNSPTAALTWTVSAAAPLTLLRQTDGTVFSFGRSSGTNNPVVQMQVTDGVGATLNLTTAQTLTFSVQGTPVMSISSTQTNALSATIAGFYAITSGANAVDMAMRAYDAGPLGLIGTISNHGLQIRTNDTPRISIDAAGVVTMNASTSGNPHIINGAGEILSVISSSTDSRLYVQNTTTGTGISAGTMLGNIGGLAYLYNYSGGISFGASGADHLDISASGNISATGPSSGQGVVFNSAVANAATLAVNNTNAGSGTNYGLDVLGGTNATDSSARFFNAAGSAILFNIHGDGSINTSGQTALGAGIINAAGLAVAGNLVYAGIPQNAQTGSYTLVLADANKHIFNNTGGAHTYTIPANASVPFPIGTAITFITGGGSGAVTLSITSDTLAFYPSAATGSRTLAPNSSATIIKVLPTVWILTGVGVS